MGDISDDEDGLDDLDIWANSVEFQETDEDLNQFLLGDQRSKKAQVKHAMNFFNTYLKSKKLPEYDSTAFRREFITQKLLTGFVKWFCTQDLSL